MEGLETKIFNRSLWGPDPPGDAPHGRGGDPVGSYCDQARVGLLLELVGESRTQLKSSVLSDFLRRTLAADPTDVLRQHDQGVTAEQELLLFSVTFSNEL